MNISASELIERYGHEVSIVNSVDNTVQKVKAFIQPFRPNSDTYLIDTDNNTNDDGIYLYIGDPIVRLDTYPIGTQIQDEGNNYILKKADTMRISENIIYIRAILHKN